MQTGRAADLPLVSARVRRIMTVLLLVFEVGWVGTHLHLFHTIRGINGVALVAPLMILALYSVWTPARPEPEASGPSIFQS